MRAHRPRGPVGGDECDVPDLADVVSPIVPPGWPPGYEHWPRDQPVIKVERMEPGQPEATVWVVISTDRWSEDYSLDGVYATEALALAAVDSTPLTVVTITEEPLRLAPDQGAETP